MRQKEFSSSHCQGNLSATIQTQGVFLKHLPTTERFKSIQTTFVKLETARVSYLLNKKTTKKSSYKDELEIQRIIKKKNPSSIAEQLI